MEEGNGALPIEAAWPTGEVQMPDRRSGSKASFPLLPGWAAAPSGRTNVMIRACHPDDASRSGKWRSTVPTRCPYQNHATSL